MFSKAYWVPLLAAAAGVTVLAGCGSGDHSEAVVAASANPTGSSSAGRITHTPATGSVAPVVLGREFVAEICPFSPAVRYGDVLNAALTQYATPAFAAKARYSRSKTTKVAARMAADQSAQTCGPITGGTMPEAANTVTTRWLRYSAAVTVSSTRAAASSAETPFFLTMTLTGRRWLISNGRW